MYLAIYFGTDPPSYTPRRFWDSDERKRGRGGKGLIEAYSDGILEDGSPTYASRIFFMLTAGMDRWNGMGRLNDRYTHCTLHYEVR